MKFFAELSPFDTATFLLVLVAMGMGVMLELAGVRSLFPQISPHFLSVVDLVAVAPNLANFRGNLNFLPLLNYSIQI